MASTDYGGSGRAYTVLSINTLAFTVAFAAWMTYGVLITFLVDNGEYDWDKAQIGWLIGVPVPPVRSCGCRPGC